MSASDPAADPVSAQSVTRRTTLKQFGVGLASMGLVCAGAFAQATGPGSALSFDGTGAYVAIATTGSLTGTFTVELWARPNEPNLAVALVGSRAPSEYGFDAKFMRGAIVHADIGDGTGWLTSGDDGYLPYNPGEWHATLTNYWLHSPWLNMTNFGQQCGGEFQFALTNASAWNFSVLYSTNLAATNWDYLGIAYRVYHFADSAASNGAPQRFYRLRWP